MDAIPAAEKEWVVVAIDLGNSKCKASVDILDESKRATAPQCFRNGPVCLSTETSLSYRSQEVVEPDLPRRKPWGAKEATVCRDFVWPLSSYLRDEAKTEEEGKTKKLPLWLHQQPKISKKYDAIIVDYLSWLYRQLVRLSRCETQLWAQSKFDWLFVFSVPASFTIEDKNHFDTLIQRWNKHKSHKYMITWQPVAAALYAIKHKHEAKEDVQHKMDLVSKSPMNKAFMTCDLAARRTELMSFHVHKEKPRVVMVPTAIKNKRNSYNGSDLIDNAFLEHALLEHIVNGIRIEDPKLRKEFERNPKDAIRSLDWFIKRKDKMKGLELEDMKIKLYGVRINHQDSKSGYLRITRDQLISFFTPCVENTLGHIINHIALAKQLGIDIEFVVLVGGLASSEYFVERIRNGLIQAEYDIQVWAPNKPEEVTSKGMVLQAQQWPYPDQNSSTASYGFVKKNGDIMWFFNQGQSYRSKKIRKFRHTIKLFKMKRSLLVKLVRHRGDLENRPNVYKENMGLSTEVLKVRDFPIKIDDTLPGKSRRHHKKWGFRIHKNLFFQFGVSNHELSFRITDEENRELLNEGWDEMD